MVELNLSKIFLNYEIKLFKLNYETIITSSQTFLLHSQVKEYFRRYYRELKKREEMFIEEIETFGATESRLMRNLHDILEIESSNISEG